MINSFSNQQGNTNTKKKKNTTFQQLEGHFTSKQNTRREPPPLACAPSQRRDATRPLSARLGVVLPGLPGVPGLILPAASPMGGQRGASRRPRKCSAAASISWARKCLPRAVGGLCRRKTRGSPGKRGKWVINPW